MLWILPACSGWLLVFPQVHWCFSINVSYTRPVGDTRDRTAIFAILALAKKSVFCTLESTLPGQNFVFDQEPQRTEN